MARHAPSNANPSCESGGYRVELPRECDAIGVVLRDAYERDVGVPDDMAMLLRKIGAQSVTPRC